MFNEKPSAEPGTKGRWPKGKANRVPRVKVLNYLKKVGTVIHALNMHGSCREQARCKAVARAVQTGIKTALNELVPIRKKSCAYREKYLCQYAKCLVPIGKISGSPEHRSDNHRGYIVGT